VVEPIN